MLGLGVFWAPAAAAAKAWCKLARINAETQRCEDAKMNENQTSKVIVDSAIEVHREIGGPGLIESVYEEAMVEELQLRGMKVERQLYVPILYKGKQLASPFRLDLKVNGLVLIDNKAVTEWNSIFEALAVRSPNV